MRHALSIPAMIFLATALGVPAFAVTDSVVDAPIISCGNGIPGGVTCASTKKGLKGARSAYAHGRKLHEHGRLEEALTEFNDASRLAPEDALYLSAREVTKAQLVFQHTERGDGFLADAQREQAAAEYRSALMLDPDNAYTRQRLAEAMRDPSASSLARRTSLTDSTEIHLQPKGERATFHYTGDARGLFTELAAAYGLQVEFDDSVAARTVRFFVDDVDFTTALSLACKSSKTMWTPLAAHQFLLAADTPDNHKQFDRMSLGTFEVPGASTPQAVTEVINSLRNVCDFQKISTGQGGTVEVRAPQPILRACATLLHQLSNEPPEVMFDIQVFQISHTFARNIGLHIPDTFNLFNIPVAALAALGGQNIQQLINELIASGGINQAGNTSLSALLAQLQGQQNSIFSQPLATFGGGLTFSGLSLDQLSAALSLNESWSRSLSHVTLRAEQGNEANLHLGERFPILNSSFAPVFNSPQIASVIGNQSFVPPFPSISYEDLGLSLKAKPVIHGDGQVSLALELQVRSLTGQSANGVPVISNQEYKGSIRVDDGEAAVVAGEITSNDTRAMTGIPGLGMVPGLNQAMVNNTVTTEDDELLVVITPHILANHDRTTDEIWVSQK